MRGRLKLDSVSAGYEGSTVLQSVSMGVAANSVTVLLGRNGVGKTTTLRTIMGLLEPQSGTIELDGDDITGQAPHDTQQRGVSMVTEERDIFPDLTVEENLRVPVVNSPDRVWSLNELYEVFPTLADLREADGKNLSGGEQQMLAIARALRPGPDVLLLDEPSEGLAPQIVEDVADTVSEIAQTDTTVLLVEQNARLALDLADYAYFMRNGRIAHEGAAADLADDREVIDTYLGVSAAE